MKLYTKQMFLIAAEKCEVSMIDAKHIMKYIDEYVTPIELPSDDELEKEACIDFAKWLAQDWMSIWCLDKWMWECQTDGVHLGPYKTEEELYELYLKSV